MRYKLLHFFVIIYTVQKIHTFPAHFSLFCECIQQWQRKNAERIDAMLRAHRAAKLAAAEALRQAPQNLTKEQKKEQKKQKSAAAKESKTKGSSTVTAQEDKTAAAEPASESSSNATPKEPVPASNEIAQPPSNAELIAFLETMAVKTPKTETAASTSTTSLADQNPSASPQAGADTSAKTIAAPSSQSTAERLLLGSIGCDYFSPLKLFLLSFHFSFCSGTSSRSHSSCLRAASCAL